MTYESEESVTIPDGRTLRPQIDERIDAERKAALPDIAAWLVRRYLRDVEKYTQPRVTIFLEQDPFCTINWKYIHDPILIRDLRPYLEERGWRVEIYGKFAYLTPVSQVDPDPEPGLEPVEAEKCKDEATVDVAPPTSWWRSFFAGDFFRPR